MEVVGWIAVVVVAAAILAGAVIGVRSIPDVQRYLKMRRM
ncbi:hypothetical protein Mycch_2109 [Mycolicibacterium chubuense NBB4]|uniref:Uncharacterized protein n=1 Tax=Mycolicibacterium chubuense (strain NBB4) TaxID=710421 RepID=I4BHY5_MYCCN|nr:hypothetical protein Mycch_2109 [Mycolicibacterium chubuense NBB4]